MTRARPAPGGDPTAGSWRGTVHSIHVAPASGAPMVEVAGARALTGTGLEGDRYAARTGTFSNTAGTGRAVTLIELESIRALSHEEGVDLAPGDARRNIVTHDVPLNHLVGRDFRVGEALLRGTRLCEPCLHPEELTGIERLTRKLLHRAGLRAEVVTGGTIRRGDAVTPA